MQQFAINGQVQKSYHIFRASHIVLHRSITLKVEPKTNIKDPKHQRKMGRIPGIQNIQNIFPLSGSLHPENEDEAKEKAHGHDLHRAGHSTSHFRIKALPNETSAYFR